MRSLCIAQKSSASFKEDPVAAWGTSRMFHVADLYEETAGAMSAISCAGAEAERC